MVLLAPTAAPPQAPRGSRRSTIPAAGPRSPRTPAPNPDDVVGQRERVRVGASSSAQRAGIRSRLEQVRRGRLQVGLLTLCAAGIVAVAAGAGIGGVGRSSGSSGRIVVREIPFTSGATEAASAPAATPSAKAADVDAVPSPTLPLAARTSTSVVSPTPLPLIVHTAGAVAHPGVYVLVSGARAADAVYAAGGMTSDADPDRVNLATVLTDGSRLYIPHKGVAIPLVPVDQITGAAPAVGMVSDAKAVIDLNSATAEQLDSLPGVGPATAAAIIEHRTRVGRFKSVNQLLDVPGIGEAKLASMRKQLTVG